MSNDGSDCPLGTLFNAYYQPAGSSTVVLLYAQPQGIPRIQLPDQPAGAGHGQYWFTAVDPVTLEEFDRSPAIVDDGRNTTQNQSPASAPASRNLQYIHRDHLGSTRLMTDEQGTEIGRWKYFPFGMEATVEESGDQRMKFTGHERDGEVELDYMLARSFSSVLVRFLTADLIDTTEERQRLPQLLHLYAYVGSNPIAVTDPSGMEGEPTTEPEKKGKLIYNNAAAEAGMYDEFRDGRLAGGTASAGGASSTSDRSLGRTPEPSTRGIIVPGRRAPSQQYNPPRPASKPRVDQPTIKPKTMRTSKIRTRNMESFRKLPRWRRILYGMMRWIGSVGNEMTGFTIPVIINPKLAPGIVPQPPEPPQEA